MKKYQLPILSAVMALNATAQALPAFPGAEGFGTETTGGRGGKVYVVTTLEDYAPGSLREAVNARGPRTIVFRVGGEIKLENPLEIRNDHITIAGQTAPGGGITLRGKPLLIDAKDVVVRFLRVRLGGSGKTESDTISIEGSASNVVLDHVSASWSTDEVLSPSGNIRDITVQWCLISEGLNNSTHKKGAHGYGSLLRSEGGITLHHNLYAHNKGRNPRFGDNYGHGDPIFDFRNNVIYGWGEYASGTTDGDIKVNYVANYIRPAPYSNLIEPISLTRDADKKTRFYVSDNIYEGNSAMTQDNSQFVGFSVVKQGGSFTLAKAPFPAPKIAQTSAQEAYPLVLAQVGASIPKRDAVDERVINQVKNHSGQLVDRLEDVGGWPVIEGGVAPVDSDMDGMPDTWEIANGLDPQNSADANLLMPDGYTAIEHYINELAHNQLATLIKKP